MGELHPSVTLTPSGPVHLAGEPSAPDDWGYRLYPAACGVQRPLDLPHYFSPPVATITCPDCLRLIPPVQSRTPARPTSYQGRAS